MHYQPHNYQSLATRFIEEHPQAAIFLGMGLGKTVITLTAIWNLVLDSFQARRVLVIAPLRVARDTWPAEVHKWSHLDGLTVAVAVGTRQQRMDALAAAAMVTVINRENVAWLVKQVGPAWPFDMVVIDELSSFKNHKAARFKALNAIRPCIHRIVGLTGTPAANGLEDLWAQFKLLDGGQRLGRYITRYRERWFTPDRRNGMQVFSYKPRAGSEEEIYEAISDITLSMKTTDYLKLPALTVTNTMVTLEPAEREVYEQMVRNMVVELDGATVDAQRRNAFRQAPAVSLRSGL